jgi:4-amino-4-deoxy-L-arabinose transferase-like glycosyltransferase
VRFSLMTRLQRHPFFFLALACAALFYLPLGLRALWGGEARWAEMAREMLELRAWVVPHLNYAAFLDQPPLVAWLTSLTLAALGPTAFAARFWCAAFGLLTVWLTFRWGMHWKNERVGLLAGGLLATSTAFFAFTQYATPDVILTFWTTLTLMGGSSLLFERSAPRARRMAYLAAAGAAGGILTQGPAALVLPAITLAVVSLSQGRRVSRVKIPWKAASLVGIALAAPWFIGITLREPAFPYHFFIREPFERYFTDPNGQPFYFYGLALIAGFFPWIVFLPKVIHAWFAHRHAALQRDPEGAVMVTWVCLVFICLTIAESKTAGWLLPVFPALALLLANELDEALTAEDETSAGAEAAGMPLWIGTGVAALIGVFFILLIVLKWPFASAYFGRAEWKTLLTQSDLLTLVLGLGIFVLVGAWGMRQTLTCVAGIMVVHGLLLTGAASLAPALDRYRSTRFIAERFMARAAPGEPIAAFGLPLEGTLQSLPFYLRRQIPSFGPDSDSLQAMISQPAGTWGVTDPTHWQILRQNASSDTFQLVEQSGDLVLFRKGH